ncbi:MAG TPA: hypothetical protein VLV83_01410 [Acidobacteriota bacterium]|nr:hypothetical protein [Acidobacteriota bacterium]
MKKHQALSMILVGSLFLFSALAFASGTDLISVDDLTGEIFLEMQLEADTVGPKTCDYAHYPPTCQRFHLKEVEKTPAATRITLENDVIYDVTWSGNGVRLENGVVIAPKGDASNPTGWMQVWPNKGDISLDNWLDSDHSATVSVSDVVSINGEEVKVKDAYFFMWLKPIE